MSVQQIFIQVKRGFYDYVWDSTTGDRDSSSETFVELDGVISEKHTNIVKLTQHPVEYGARITDHAIKQPYKIVVRGVVTNTPLAKQLNKKLPNSGSILDQGTDSFKGTRIQSAYQGLINIQNKRWPVTLQTGLRSYSNMVLTSVSTPHDIKNRLDLTMVFEEVIIPKNLKNTDDATYKKAEDPTALNVANVASMVAGLALSGVVLAGG